MVREMLGAAQLLELLNEELDTDPATRDCRFDGEIAIACDENGCNWRAPDLKGTPAAGGQEKIDTLIEAMQQKYCVDEED